MRKYQWLLIITLIGGMVFFASCDQAQDMLDPIISEPKPPEVIEDDTLDTTTFRNRLTIEGATAISGAPPTPSTAETAPTIEADVSEINVSPGGTISLPFAYSGANNLSGRIVCIEGVDGYYDLPYTGAADDLLSAISATIPQDAALGSFTVCYSVYDDQGQNSNLITAVINVTAPEPPDMLVVRKLYWGDGGTYQIQRADPDGSNIETIVTGVQPWDLALDVAGGKIYWVSHRAFQNNVQRANLDGSNVEELVSGRGGQGIGLDVAAGKMYWAGNSGIHRANLNGSGIETLITGLLNPDSMDLDLIDNKIYWTDSLEGTIYRANLNGTNIELLVTGLNHPQGLNLDLANGKMYWSNWPPLDKIQRANLDGTGIEDIAPGLGGLEGIALDFNAGKMYWTDFNIDKIQRANFDGTDIEDLVTTGLSHPQAITFDVGPIN